MCLFVAVCNEWGDAISWATVQVVSAVVRATQLLDIVTSLSHPRHLFLLKLCGEKVSREGGFVQTLVLEWLRTSRSAFDWLTINGHYKNNQSPMFISHIPNGRHFGALFTAWRAQYACLWRIPVGSSFCHYLPDELFSCLSLWWEPVRRVVQTGNGAWWTDSNKEVYMYHWTFIWMLLTLWFTRYFRLTNKLGKGKLALKKSLKCVL